MAGKVGRPAGISKSKKILGYKYTPDEYELINNTLEELREKYKTTSRAILELCTFYQKNKKGSISIKKLFKDYNGIYIKENIDFTEIEKEND